MNQLQATCLGCLLFCLTAGCSAPSNTGSENSASPSATASSSSPAAAAEPSFQVAIQESEKLEFEPNVQKLDVRPDTKRSSLVLGNYDFKLEPMSANSIEDMSDPSQMRVQVSFKHRPDATYEKPITVGEYEGQTTAVDIYVFREGQQKILNLENEQGKMVVDSVEGDEVSGSLEITGDKGAMVKGPFKATIVH